MNSFNTSTQFNNWIKTEEQLQKVEKSKLERILKRINEVNKLIKKENEELSHKINGENNDNKNKAFQKYISPKKLLVTPNDEKILVINYSSLIIKRLNKQKDKSTSLKNNVVSYFRRFFLKKSILDYDPDFLMASAFLLGAKVSSMNYTNDDYLKIFPILQNNWEKFYEYEFYLCTILEYDFFVYNPFQALLGFIYELEKEKFFQDKENKINPELFKNDCQNIIDKLYLTDCIFLYTYSELALASIYIQCDIKNINTNNIEQKLNLNKIMNVKEFIDNKVVDIKKKLDEIPKFNSTVEEEQKSTEIMRNVGKFHMEFPKYKEQLKEERNKLTKKMNDFENNFSQFEVKKQK